jgi:hypothetical protein
LKVWWKSNDRGRENENEEETEVKDTAKNDAEKPKDSRDTYAEACVKKKRKGIE